MLEIRCLRSTDIALCMNLCRLAGWNHVDVDWLRLLDLSPEGLFLAEYKGQACGIVSTIQYGPRLGWMGLLMVHHEFRRRGIGSALMNHGIEFLKQRDVRRIKIDATDAGRSVFLKLGFEDERPVHVFVGRRPANTQPSDWHTDGDVDWQAAAEMDTAAFRADRLDLLKLLRRDGYHTSLTECAAMTAYGFAQQGFYASRLGPVVAATPEAARTAVTRLLGILPEGNVIWNLLPDNVHAKELAASLGFTLHERLTRMYLGTAAHPGNLDTIYATGGSEVG